MSSSIADWISRHDDIARPLIPAATVLLVRDGSAGIETVMMRRNTQLSFAEGMWVFPGGKIDPGDHPPSGPDDAEAAANAAVREAKEEADLDVDIRGLVHYSHWLPPVEAPKRFSTWFFLARAPSGQVTVDKGEILEHAWWRPTAALQRCHDRRIQIMPPTWMSLHHMSRFSSVDALIEAVIKNGPAKFATRLLQTADGRAAAWEGDVAYLSGDPDAPGPRNRLVMTSGEWRRERS